MVIWELVGVLYNGVLYYKVTSTQLMLLFNLMSYWEEAWKRQKQYLLFVEINYLLCSYLVYTCCCLLMLDNWFIIFAWFNRLLKIHANNYNVRFFYCLQPLTHQMKKSLFIWIKHLLELPNEGIVTEIFTCFNSASEERIQFWQHSMHANSLEKLVININNTILYKL